VNNTSGNIEKYFRESFSGFEITPTSGLWSKIIRKVQFRQFFRFNIGSLNVYYVALGSMLVAGTLMLRNVNTNQKAIEYPQISIGEQGTNIPERSASTPKEVAGTKNLKTKEDHKVVKEEEKSGTMGEHLQEGTSTDRTSLRTSGKPVKNGKINREQTLEKIPAGKTQSTVSKPKNNLKNRVKASFYMVSPIGCVPLTVQFRNTSSFAKTYRWDFGDGTISNKEAPNHIFTHPGDYIVRLEASGRDGKNISEAKRIVVVAPPKADFEMNTSENNFSDGAVVFHNYSENATRCIWEFGDGTTSEEYSPVHDYKVSGNYTVKLKVWSEEGCVDSLVLINPFKSEECTIEFPNAFTPNLNGPSNGYYTEGRTTNEVFHPLCKGLLEYRLRIYNRFGTLIFESNDVKIGWDGYVNGTLSKPDVYIWKAHGRFTNGESFMKFGNVTLVRKK